MPRVKLASVMAGPEGCFHPGAVLDVSEEQARALVAGSFAEYVDPPPAPPVAPTPEPETADEPEAEPEAATLEPDEVAVTRRGRLRGRG